MGEELDTATAPEKGHPESSATSTAAASGPPQRRSFLDRLAASGHQSPGSNKMDKELPPVPPSDITAERGDNVSSSDAEGGTAGMPERSRSFFDRFGAGAWGQQKNAATNEATAAAPMSDITSHDGVATDVNSGVTAGPQRTKSRLDRVAGWGHPDGYNNGRVKASATVASPASTAGMTDDSYGRGSSEVGTGAGVPQRTPSRLDRWANFGYKESKRPSAAAAAAAEAGATAPVSDTGVTDHDTAAGVGSSVGAPPQRTRSRLDRFADLGHRDGGGGWRSPSSVTGAGSGVAAPSTVADVDLGHDGATEVETNVSIPQRSPSFLDRLAVSGYRDTRRTRPIAGVVEEEGGGTGVETSAAVSSPTYNHGGSNAGVETDAGLPQRKPSILDRLAATGHQQGKRKSPTSSSTAGGAVVGPESTAGVSDSAPSPTEVEAHNASVPQQQQQQGSWFGWMTGAGQQDPNSPSPPAETAPPVTTSVDHSDGDGLTDIESGAAAAAAGKPQRRSWLDRIAASGHREGERSARASKALPSPPAEGETTTASNDYGHEDVYESTTNAQGGATDAALPRSEPVGGGKGGGFKRRLDRILPPQKTRGWFGRRPTEHGEKGLPEVPAGGQ